MKPLPLILVVLLAAQAAGGATPTTKATPAPPPTEAGVRAMLGLPANAPLRYLADDGTPLTFAAFAAHVPAASFDAHTDPATRVTTLQFIEVGGRREIGAVTHLPPLDATTLDGRRVRSAQFGDRLTFVNFFFSTCAPCLREIPMLNEFQRLHPDVRVLAISPDSAAEARALVRDRNFLWPIVADAHEYIRAARVTAYPTWLLIAKDGRIIGRGTGLGEEAMRDPAVALVELERWIAARRRR